MISYSDCDQSNTWPWKCLLVSPFTLTMTNCDEIERESVYMKSVCVCVCKRERERICEIVCVNVCWECLRVCVCGCVCFFVCVCECVCMSDNERLRVCVCVKERMCGVRVRVSEWKRKSKKQQFTIICGKILSWKFKCDFDMLRCR